MSTNDTTYATYAAYVGIDWADQTHSVCVRAAQSQTDEPYALPQDPQAIHAWARALHARFPHGPIAVAVEQSRGPLIYALLQHAHLALFPINPAILTKYREAATAASGVKDDPLDAQLACEVVRLHRDWLRVLRPPPAAVRQLQLLVEARRGFVEQRTAFCEQLGAALKAYFPQALKLSGDLNSPLCWALLRRWPTLTAIQAARTTTLERFYREHGVHSAERIAERVALVRSAVALTADPAVLAALPVQVAVLLAQLAALAPAIADYDRRIAGLFAQQADAALFAALPGAGAQLAPRLYVAFGPDRSRFKSAAEIQCLSGIAPVTTRSGKMHLTQWRWHCPTFLRQTFQEFAGCSVPHSRWAQAFYQLQLERGKSPQQAKRALAYKWQRILFRCWQENQPYDEARYIANLRHRHSSLVPRIDALQNLAA
jgi:transposase